jgi:hypothetical protein
MLNSESARLCSSTRIAVLTVLSEQSNAGLAANSVARLLVPARQCWDGVGNFHAASEFAGRASPTGRHLQLVSCSCKLLHAPLATSASHTSARADTWGILLIDMRRLNANATPQITRRHCLRIRNGLSLRCPRTRTRHACRTCGQRRDRL